VDFLVVALYLVAATISGRLSPLARRPLLDGFVVPPPYDWVSPPPALAATNKRPSIGRLTLNVDPTTGSEANVLATADNQASLAVAEGSFPPRGADVSVALVITPLAPIRNATMPTGFQIAGNVYRFTAVYRPSGTSIARLSRSAQLVLSYPVASTTLAFRHSVLRSRDGRAWTALRSTDSLGEQLVQANVSELGYFAVGQSSSGSMPPGKSIGHIVSIVAIWGGIAVLAVFFMVAEIRHRMARRKRAGRAPRRRTPPSRKRFDPWE
jgi:hypothetical protein